MCGIAGIARLGSRTLGAGTDAVLDRLADILDHRGPDEREILRDDAVGLVFTRLALVNPEDGSQPLVSDDGSLVLVANGEVYNHRELAAALPGGARMRTGSDCEVLLHLYRHHGLDFLRDVRGMFALILWDRDRNQLVLARDRFGIKPLYYHRDDARIVLSSEIKGLFADPATPAASTGNGLSRPHCWPPPAPSTRHRRPPGSRASNWSPRPPWCASTSPTAGPRSTVTGSCPRTPTRTPTRRS
ncbi:hypothetical protein GTY20_05400 [Streptomyces sp. SID4946]|nr:MULTISPECIES: hypothetical protein [unclassified Streptomyces]MYQ90815.1 hypothetical protein [Streptomyces sp. SID4946]